MRISLTYRLLFRYKVPFCVLVIARVKHQANHSFIDITNSYGKAKPRFVTYDYRPPHGHITNFPRRFG